MSHKEFPPQIEGREGHSGATIVSPNAAFLTMLTNELAAGRVAHEAGLAEQQAFKESALRVEELTAGITDGNQELLPNDSHLFDVLTGGAAKRMSELVMDTRGQAFSDSEHLTRAINRPREVLIEAAYGQEEQSPEDFLSGVQALFDESLSKEERQKLLDRIDPIIQSVVHDRKNQGRHYKQPVVALDNGQELYDLCVSPTPQVMEHNMILSGGFDPSDPYDDPYDDPYELEQNL